MFSSIIGTETKLNPETLSAAGCCGVEQDTRRDRDRKMAGGGGLQTHQAQHPPSPWTPCGVAEFGSHPPLHLNSADPRQVPELHGTSAAPQKGQKKAPLAG